jgi:hypothetical protein
VTFVYFYLRNELDADMESSMINNGGGGLAAAPTTLFGGLGFGAPKTNEPPKTGFGGFGTPSLFGAAITTPSNQSPTIGAQAQQQKSPFGSILKTATFNAGGQTAGNLFGSNATPPATNTSGGGLFSLGTSGQNQSGSLFNSFKTPQKTGFGAPATTFGASPAFGSAPAFGTSSFGAAPAFGASSNYY